MKDRATKFLLNPPLIPPRIYIDLFSIIHPPIYIYHKFKQLFTIRIKQSTSKQLITERKQKIETKKKIQFINIHQFSHS